MRVRALPADCDPYCMLNALSGPRIQMMPCCCVVLAMQASKAAEAGKDKPQTNNTTTAEVRL